MESPFIYKLGFKKLIENVENQSSSTNQVVAGASNFVLENITYKEDLIEGIDESNLPTKYKKDVDLLMNILFPQSLLNNEIKLAMAPSNQVVLFKSNRFKKIFGDNKEIKFGSLKEIEDPDLAYIVSCITILKAIYGADASMSNAQYCDIIDKMGLNKHYRALMNAEFFEIFPVSGKIKPISHDEIQTLLHSGLDIKLWKKYFPPNSWVLKGFGIVNLFDATKEQSLSNFKDLLIVKNKFQKKQSIKNEISQVIRSYLNIPDLDIDILLYDNKKQQLEKIDGKTPCIGLGSQTKCSASKLFCDYTMSQLFKNHKNLVLPNIDDVLDRKDVLGVIGSLYQLGYKSYLAIPILDNNKILGILELASKKPYTLNSLVEYDLRTIKPITESSIKAHIDGYSNKLSAIIQNECTAIHPSVEWRFYEEAENFLLTKFKDESANYEEIVFHNLYALYGQIDVAGSSVARNNAIVADLSEQLNGILNVLTIAEKSIEMPLIKSTRFQANMLLEQINANLGAGIEQEAIHFIKQFVSPLLVEISSMNTRLSELVSKYNSKIHPELGIIYNERKKYDQSLEIIGQKMASSIDKKQVAAQGIFPHYFERYQTDGVEHNMFIGQSIAPSKNFQDLYVKNLHLWQLKAMCEMEREHDKLKSKLPLPLNVASLIMVYSTPLSIRYRMDEKQFDIDGAYNARYEILKKRIDKAHIKNTSERITQPGKMVIVFTQQSDLDEYRSHINYLIYEGLLKNEVEILELENLQGVVGLRAIRVSIHFNQKTRKILPKRKLKSLQSN